jgi:hypothetical protein
MRRTIRLYDPDLVEGYEYDDHECYVPSHSFEPHHHDRGWGNI